MHIMVFGHLHLLPFNIYKLIDPILQTNSFIDYVNIYLFQFDDYKFALSLKDFDGMIIFSMDGVSLPDDLIYCLKLFPSIQKLLNISIDAFVNETISQLSNLDFKKQIGTCKIYSISNKYPWSIGSLRPQICDFIQMDEPIKMKFGILGMQKNKILHKHFIDELNASEILFLKTDDIKTKFPIITHLVLFAKDETLDFILSIAEYCSKHSIHFTFFANPCLICNHDFCIQNFKMDFIKLSNCCFYVHIQFPLSSKSCIFKGLHYYELLFNGMENSMSILDDVLPIIIQCMVKNRHIKFLNAVNPGSLYFKRNYLKTPTYKLPGLLDTSQIQKLNPTILSVCDRLKIMNQSSSLSINK